MPDLVDLGGVLVLHAGAAERKNEVLVPLTSQIAHTQDVMPVEWQIPCSVLPTQRYIQAMAEPHNDR